MNNETIFYLIGLALGFTLGYAVKSLRVKQSVRIEVITNKMIDEAVKVHTPDKDYKPINGEWIETDDENGYESYRCSNCGCEQVAKTIHCPNCGAKMKGGSV